jgi:serine/threonine protein phosphatase PrpC
MPTPLPADPGLAAQRKPRDDEIEVHGLTHVGRVRTVNQDHFLFSTLHKTMRVRVTSLPTPELLELPGERLASLFMVADGVGGSEEGEEASRLALETVSAYVTRTMQCYYRSPASDDRAFLAALEEMARTCHDTVVERARELGVRKMSTTLTLGLAVWPRLYLLHVGDSRCYRYRAGALERLTSDQTMAQALVDSGALRPDQVDRSPLRHVLASAIGSTSMPALTLHDLRHGDVLLACTDGLTRHVSDARIAERLGGMASSAQACQALLDEALEAGGTDNVTVLVVRSVVRPEPGDPG